MLDGDGSGEVDAEEFIETLYRMMTTESKTAVRFVKEYAKRSDAALDVIKTVLVRFETRVASIEQRMTPTECPSGSEAPAVASTADLAVKPLESTLRKVVDESLHTALGSLSEKRDTVQVAHGIRPRVVDFCMHLE